jgi:hypothetical protein
LKTRVYKYGLRPPTIAQNVEEQIKAAHQYKNKLVEIELKRLGEIRQALSTHPTIEPLEEEVGVLREKRAEATDAVRQYRARTRARRAPKELTTAAKDASKALREKCSELKEAKRALKNDAAVQEAIATINDQAKVAVKKARSTCGCYWGTYLLMEQAVDQAKQSDYDPTFKRWNGSGMVGVQVQGGLSVEGLFSDTDTRLQIDPVDPAAWDKRRSPLQRTLVRLRVGSEGRAPIWAEWPLLLHRPLPPEAQVTWAKVVKERLGGKSRWTLHLTLRLPDTYRRERCGSGTVALDVGWRKQGETLRVGYWRDDNGSHGEIKIEEAVLSGLKKVEDLRSIRDKNLDKLRPLFVAWLKEANLPPWMVDETKFIGRWKSTARFAALALRWRENRWGGDEDGYELLETWRKRDKHLWLYEVNLRDQVYRRRKDQYRVLAAKFARQYDILVLEAFNKSTVARKKPVEDEKGEAHQPRSQRFKASSSELCECFTAAFIDRGGRVLKENPAFTTQECYVCGSVEPWDAAPTVWHTCEACGASWDQDHNAVLNLLRRFREWRQGAKNTGGARTKEIEVLRDTKPSKWAKRGRHKKTARRATANQPEV